MARFARRSNARRGKPVHPTTWCSHDAFNQSLTADGSNVVIICNEAKFETFTSPTIVRIRGQIVATLSVDNLFSASIDQFHFALGLGILPTGLTAYPSILTEDGAEAPWMWTHYSHAIMEWNSGRTFTSAGALTTDFQQAQGRWQQFIDVDVRAMRRVPKDYFLGLQTSFAQLAGGPDLRLRGLLRVLIKE